MTDIPARMIRACTAHIIQHVPTKRELALMQHIESAGTKLFARRGPLALSLARFAAEVGVTSYMLGRLYCDLEHLFGEILRSHMTALMAELNKIPENAPNRPAQCRAAYHRLIRGPDGKVTDAHFLLVRHLHALPPDELAPTEVLRANLNAMLGAGEIGVRAATFLDSGAASLERIETMLAILVEHEARDEAAGHEMAAPERVALRPPPAANQNEPRRPSLTRLVTGPRQDTPYLDIIRPPGTVLH